MQIEITKAVEKELRLCIALLPLLLVNLRSPPSPLITASDASERGGGVCYSKTLTSEGKASYTAELSRPQAVGRDLVGILSAGDKLGSTRRALEVLGIEVAAYTAVERDESSQSVLRDA